MEFFGERLVIRLWESLERGVVGVLAPRQSRRSAEADRDRQRGEIAIESERIVAIAVAQKRAEDILAGKADTPPMVLLLESAAATGGARLEPVLLEARVERAQRAEAIDREINVAKAILAAEGALEMETSAPSESLIERDWLRRWREGASMVSDADLQVLWGRVLAGESTQPGKFSLRTLDFLKNLSKREAELIERAFRYVVDGLIHYGADLRSTLPLSVSEFFELQEWGLIEGYATSGIRRTGTSKSKAGFFYFLKCCDHGIQLESPDPALVITFPDTAQITAKGYEVSQLCRTRADLDHLRALGSKFKERYSLQATLVKFVPELGGHAVESLEPL